jgi:hypothetical protein
MLNNAIVIFGLIVVAILVLVPVVMIGLLVTGIISSGLKSRRAEARKITRVVPGLGDFSTYDNKHWHGEVDGLHISLVSPGLPPTDLQSRQVRTILEGRSRFMEKVKAYLASDENISLLPGGSEALELCGFDIEDASRFVFELVHPADEDGIYRVEFKDGEPISSGRDD